MVTEKIGVEIVISHLMQSVRSFFYPPYCWNCGEGVFDPDHFFCEACLPLLDRLDPQERCPFCFSEALVDGGCAECVQKKNSAINWFGSVFSYEGPAVQLVRRLKSEGKRSIAELCASFMVLQMDQMGWSVPDVLVPVPISKIDFLRGSYHPSRLIAQELGALFNRPVENILIRRTRVLNQESLFECKRGRPLVNRSVLLVDDVKGTGETLRCCSEALLQAHPANIYTMTFALDLNGVLDVF